MQRIQRTKARDLCDKAAHVGINMSFYRTPSGDCFKIYQDTFESGGLSYAEASKRVDDAEKESNSREAILRQNIAMIHGWLPRKRALEMLLLLGKAYGAGGEEQLRKECQSIGMEYDWYIKLAEFLKE